MTFGFLAISLYLKLMGCFGTKIKSEKLYEINTYKSVALLLLFISMILILINGGNNFW